MKLNKFFAGIVASVIGLNCMLCPPQTEAASREEIAAINVVKADDFKYWSDDSSTRQKIVRFVEEATNPASKNFIPPANRIATFDMDGTFYCETAPLYFQEVMFLHRALEDKKYSPDRKMAAFAKKIKPKILNKTGITASENKKLFEYLTKAYAGMTPEEYRAYVREFMQTNETGLTNLKRGEAFYLPMVEIISYLGNNGFAVYIDSACGFLTTRELVEGVIPIHSDRIIASDFVFTSTKMGKDKPGDHFYDRHKEKIVISGKPLVDNAKTVKIYSLLNHIGKKPVLAFGNSMGDSGMLEYTLQDNPYNCASFFVLSDDTERELGDKEKSAKLKEFALKRGWNPISMKNEFKTIYGERVKRSN